MAAPTQQLSSKHFNLLSLPFTLLVCILSQKLCQKLQNVGIPLLFCSFATVEDVLEDAEVIRTHDSNQVA